MTAITQMEAAAIESELNELASLYQQGSPPSELMAPSVEADSQITNAPANP